MQVIYNENDKNISLELDDKNIIFSSNDRENKKLLQTLKSGLSGEIKEFLYNGLNVSKKDFNIIYLDEDSDFTEEFSFSKNNELRSLIYDTILTKINTDKILNNINETLNQIDIKVNKYLDDKINKNTEFGNLIFDINIDNINDIINKYTDIYLNDLTIKSENLTKREKRLILYDFIIAKAKANDNSIIIINNFDAYLKCFDVINVLNKLEKLNCPIILSSINNIYEYINDKWSIYKYNDDLIKLDNMDELFTKIYSKYIKIEDTSLISKEDIIKVKKVYDYNRHNIGKVFVNNKLELAIKRPSKIKYDYVICNNELF